MSPPNFKQFVTKVVEEGIAGAKRDYQNQEMKLRGAVAGFAACVDKTGGELRELLFAAKSSRQQAYIEEDDNYWWYRCYEAEVEWVCNCVSVVLVSGGTTPLVEPTIKCTAHVKKILKLLHAN